jgi:hypothetical protein
MILGRIRVILVYINMDSLSTRKYKLYTLCIRTMKVCFASRKEGKKKKKKKRKKKKKKTIHAT